MSPPSRASSPASAGARRADAWELATDADLAVAAATRDREGKEAFVEIVRRHQTAVCAVAWSVAGRIGLTDDIAQETFFEAWKRMATLREPAKLRAWLTRIAHHTAVDALKREAAHESRHGEDDGPPPVCASATPDTAAAEAEEEALVWASLSALPETLRTPLVLFYREGRSVAAVAAALDLSEDAVRQRLSRGRQALRSAVESRIETVLGRIQPSALLLVTIASGIGLLTPPAAVAAGVTAGAATTSTGAATAAGTAGISTFMTTTSWFAAAVTMAAFLPLGWKAGGNAGSAEPDKTAAPHPAAAAGDPFALYANSKLLAEWRRLHAEHGSDAAAMPVLYGLIQAEPDSFRRRALGIALMSEWSAVDPEGAFQNLWIEKKNTDHAALMMREWLKRDPGQAAAHLLTRLKGSEALATAVAHDIADLAPDHFIAVLTALPQPGTDDGLPPSLARAIHFFASRHLQAAIDALPLLDGAALRSARVSIGPLLARTDPKAGLKWARALNTEDERMAAGNGVMSLWAKTDPAAALASLDSSAESRRLAMTVLMRAAEHDLSAALRLWNGNREKFGEEPARAFRDALHRKFGENPLATVEILRTQPRDVQEELGKELRLGDLRPAAADTLKDWASRQPPGGLAEAVRGELLLRDFQTNTPEALRYLASLPDASQAAACERAGDFITDLERGEFETLLGIVPAAARAALIEAGFKKAGREATPDVPLWRRRLDELPPDTQNRKAREFAGSLVDTDPRLAVSFADALPDGPVKDAAYAGVMGDWAVLDSLQASAWADSQPSGTARDAASVELVRMLFASSDVDAALTWAASIGNTELRLNSLREFRDHGYHHDPGTLRAFLSSPLLSPADREALERGRGGEFTPSK